MAITFTLKSFDTNESGDISSMSTLNNIKIDDINFEQTVGDEIWLETGEIKLTTYNAITARDWIALYMNNILVEVFSFKNTEYDEKYGKYVYVLYPIQKTFIDDLASTLIVFTADLNSWNYYLDDALAAWASFSVLDGDGNTQTGTLVSGFQPLKMVRAMIEQTNDAGYYVAATNFDGSAITVNVNDKYTLFRGTGISNSASYQTKLTNTFSNDGTNNFDMTWFDIFRLISYTFNAYIKITPEIDEFDRLGIHIDITSRENITAGTPVSVLTFIERKKIFNKYQIDGVLIKGSNFEYKLGNFQKQNIFEKEIELSDFTIAEPNYLTALYLQSYEGGQPFWFRVGGLVDDYYNGLINAGHGYEGKCEINYNDGAEKILKVLDQVSFSGTTIMLNRLQVGLSGLADYEGIII